MLGSGAAAICRSRRRRPMTGFGRGGCGLPGAWRGRCGPAASAGRGGGALRIARLSRRRLLSRCGDGAAGAAGAGVARAAARGWGRDPRALAGSLHWEPFRAASRHAPPPAPCALRTAIVAIGGAAKAPRGPLRDSLTVTSSHIVLTEPVPDVLEEIGWTGGECITDSRALIDYFRTTPDGRIAFGWGGGRIAMGARLHGRAEVDPDVVAAAAAHLRQYFPALQGRRLTHAWGGPIDVSPTHLPVVVPLSGGRAFAAAGYTGNGVGPSYMVGRSPSLPSPRPPRRLLPLANRRPQPPTRPTRALPLAGRRNDPQSDDEQGGGRASQPRSEPRQLPDLPAPRPDRLPHRPLIVTSYQPGAMTGGVGVSGRAAASSFSPTPNERRCRLCEKPSKRPDTPTPPPTSA